ncbi:phage tail length tape measure family protein [Citreimonas salinaria]|uniref:Prophage tail length tape measure protein n=1 Tax=Citreimonas salinaria TaxID=321339 RepID=A0A1H3KTI3_9RHOB|nr:phage tail length tape measure family protein [Citreimonas salinaria]SDY55517.1 Prophage tail length tape measure protein [Citreimonas salinaria]
MALNFHARLTADGRQAQGEIKSTADELRRLDTALQGVESEGRDAATALASVEAKAATTAARLTDTGSAARGVQQTHTLAAGSVGNLTAQFNDLGVMMAAGQNPLQLALQQGTQITQVIGPMGAAGAVKALGTAFMGLLSPVNLVTIGAIAAGAAIVQWLTSSEDQANELTDALEAARAKTAELERDNTRMLRGFASTEELALADQVEAAAAELARVQAQLTEEEAARGRRLGLDIVAEYDAQVAAARAELQDAEKKLANLREQAALNQELKAAQEGIKLAIKDGLSALIQTGVQWQENRATAQSLLLDLQEQNELKRIALQHGEDSVEYADAHAAAERRAFEAILDTVNVSEALKDELRAAFEQGLALSQLDVSSRIWDGANAASAMAANLAGAVAQMGALAQQSIASSGARARRSQILLDTVGNPVDRAGSLAVQDYREQLDDGGYGLISSGRAEQLATNESAIRQEAEHAEALAQAAQSAEAEYRKLQTAVNGSGRGGGGRRGGGGTSELERQKKAVEDLISSQHDELAILRETDPVQQEMIRLRETLAGATAEQRAAIEANIATISAEKAAQEEIGQIRDQVGGAVSDLVPSLVQGGNEAAEAWERFGQTLRDIAIQALIVEPLLRALGLSTGSSGGGILKLLGLAEGGDPFRPAGMIHGRGGPKQDGRVIAVSPGEFIVKAEAANRNRAILEAINASAPIPGFAQGGFVSGGAAGGMMVLQTQIIDQSSRGLDIREESEPMPGGGRLQRFVVSEAVDDSANSPGTAFARTLARRGLPPKRTRR